MSELSHDKRGADASPLERAKLMLEAKAVVEHYDRIIETIDEHRLVLDRQEADFVMTVEDYRTLRDFACRDDAATPHGKAINLEGVTGDEMDKSAERAALLTRLMAAGEPRETTPSHVAPIHPLVEAVRWILQDAAYKAPEQIGVVAERWIDRLRDAMTQEGKPVSVPSTTRRKLPSLPNEIQEWCWHMDQSIEHDDRHAAMALRAAWPAVSKWLQRNVGPTEGGAPFAVSAIRQKPYHIYEHLKYTDATVDAPRQLLAYAETPGRTIQGARQHLENCGIEYKHCWPDWAYESGHLTKSGLAELVHRMMEAARLRAADGGKQT